MATTTIVTRFIQIWVFKNLFHWRIWLQKDQEQLINAGGWATDDLIFKSLQDTLQQNPEQPKFIYAITVENHPMYNDERYGKQDFKFSQNLSEIDRRKLSTYTAGTIRANQKLLELKQFLKQ